MTQRRCPSPARECGVLPGREVREPGRSWPARTAGPTWRPTWERHTRSRPGPPQSPPRAPSAGPWPPSSCWGERRGLGAEGGPSAGPVRGRYLAWGAGLRGGEAQAGARLPAGRRAEWAERSAEDPAHIPRAGAGWGLGLGAPMCSIRGNPLASPRPARPPGRMVSRTPHEADQTRSPGSRASTPDSPGAPASPLCAPGRAKPTGACSDPSLELFLGVCARSKAREPDWTPAWPPPLHSPHTRSTPGTVDEDQCVQTRSSLPLARPAPLP